MLCSKIFNYLSFEDTLQLKTLLEKIDLDLPVLKELQFLTPDSLRLAHKDWVDNLKSSNYFFTSANW